MQQLRGESLSDDEEIEGMYTLVGDPENPDLQEADEAFAKAKQLQKEEERRSNALQEIGEALEKGKEVLEGQDIRTKQCQKEDEEQKEIPEAIENDSKSSSDNAVSSSVETIRNLFNQKKNT